MIIHVILRFVDNLPVDLLAHWSLFPDLFAFFSPSVSHISALSTALFQSRNTV